MKLGGGMYRSCLGEYAPMIVTIPYVITANTKKPTYKEWLNTIINGGG